MRCRSMTFPSQKIARHFISEMPLFTASLRTLGAYCQRVCARSPSWTSWPTAAGVDPLAFRLAHMKDARASVP